MKLTKERAKKPLIENGFYNASTGYESGETTFVLDCRGPWVQGKGHESAYTMHLTKTEMLFAVSRWMQKLYEIEQNEAKARASAVASAYRSGVDK